MSSFPRRYAAALGQPLLWLGWALLSLALALAGPFGSYRALPLPQGLLMWSVLVGLILLAGLALRAWLCAPGRGAGRLGGLVVAATLFGALAAPVWLLIRLGLRDMTPPPRFAEVAGVVFCTALALVLLGCGPSPATDGRPKLLRRLPPNRQGDLISISVRGHYLDVVTSAGTASVLLRFSDAIDETSGVPGDQIHRSHWVAWEAVRGVERIEGRVLLTLADGARLPVSRAHLAKLENRGLI